MTTEQPSLKIEEVTISEVIRYLQWSTAFLLGADNKKPKIPTVLRKPNLLKHAAKIKSKKKTNLRNHQ